MPFALPATAFQPFSPLAGGDNSSNSGSSPAGCPPVLHPFCGMYLLRAGGQELAVRLESQGGAQGAA